MKILFIATVMPIVGGVVTWVNLLAGKLSQEGHWCRVISTTGSTQQFRVVSSRLGTYISRLLDCDIIFFAGFIFSRWLVYRRAAKEIKRDKIDVINAQDLNALQAVSSLCRKNDIRQVLTVHGTFYRGGTATRTFRENSWLGRYLIKQEQEAYQKADHIITVSSDFFDYVKSVVGNKKVSTLNNFVDQSIYYPFSKEKKQLARKEKGYESGDFIVLFTGRLTKAKGLEYIINSLNSLTGVVPIKLIIAGDGPFLPHMKEMLEKYGLQEIVVLTGRLNSEELLFYYNIADAYIMAPLIGVGSPEGTPMALLEAMACALPLVSTPVGGIRKVLVPGYNGFFIKERDEQDIAEALLKLYNDPEQLKVMGQNSLGLVNKYYSLDCVLENILKIYNPDKEKI